MSLISAPYGFLPVKHPSGQNRAQAYNIASAYGTAIFHGDPVKIVTTASASYIQPITATSDLMIGIFVGCEYIDSTGKPTVSNFWPAAQSTQSGTLITAWVVDDPASIFSVQIGNSTGTANTNTATIVPLVGNQINIIAASVSAGSTATGLSVAAVDFTTLVSATTVSQFRIVDIDRDPANAWTDPYLKVLVQINKHQMTTANPPVPV